MNVPLALLIPMALLAAMKARELSRLWFPKSGKTSAAFRGYGAVFMVPNKSFWWVLTGR